MSLIGAPYYRVLACKRECGLLDYVLYYEHGWYECTYVHISSCGARDEQQLLGRIQNMVRSRQQDTSIDYVDRASFNHTVHMAVILNHQNTALLLTGRGGL